MARECLYCSFCKVFVSLGSNTCLDLYLPFVLYYKPKRPNPHQHLQISLCEFLVWRRRRHYPTQVMRLS